MVIQTIYLAVSTLTIAFLAFVAVNCIWVIIQTFVQRFNILPRVQQVLRYLPKWLYFTPITLLVFAAMGFLLLVFLIQKSQYEKLAPSLCQNAFSCSFVALILYMIVKIGEIKSRKSIKLEEKQIFYKMK